MAFENLSFGLALVAGLVSFLVDRHGVIRQIFFGGPLSEETLAAAVAPLLAEAP